MKKVAEKFGTVAELHGFGAEPEFFYKNDNDIFVKEDNSEISVRDLEELAVWINSPWSQTNETYTIKINCKDGYTAIPEGDPIWKCKYTVVGYDAITAIIYGYGNTPNEALEDCMKLFDYLQKNYNKDDESI